MPALYCNGEAAGPLDMPVLYCPLHNAKVCNDWGGHGWTRTDETECPSTAGTKGDDSFEADPLMAAVESTLSEANTRKQRGNVSARHGAAMLKSIPSSRCDDVARSMEGHAALTIAVHHLKKRRPQTALRSQIINGWQKVGWADKLGGEPLPNA